MPMTAHAAEPFVDTNIIPDRNAGIGSLLWDLQHPRDPDRDGPPLLAPQFAFIDVGVSRAKVATALKTLLASDLEMNLVYVATERPEAVPYAYVTLLGDRAEEVRACLSRLVSSKEATRQVKDWHLVVDRTGKVSSVAYSYSLLGNEVWESYFMGRAFMYSGGPVEFSDPRLDEALASDVRTIEAGIEAEMQRDPVPSQPGRFWDGYRMDRNPLEAGLAELGITLQTTDVPQRITDRQNVLFLGNVLNHYPQNEQADELDRVAAGMDAGDLVIIQMDEIETPSVEVLHVTGRGTRKTRERVRWIDTRTLEVQQPVRGSGSWRQIRLKPEMERMASRLVDLLGMRARSPEWSREDHKVLVRRYVGHVFGAHFRALPVEHTLRVAVREALRRLPRDGSFQRVPVFEDDAEADLLHLVLGNPEAEMRHESLSRKTSE